MVQWNWRITRDGAIRFSLILLTLSFSYHNIAWLNSLFLPQLPVGYILFGFAGIFTLRHVYRTFRWYRTWLNGKRYQKYEKLIMHICLYLIVISVVLSIPTTIPASQNSREINTIDVDGRSIELMYNISARYPTYDELYKFLWNDNTDYQQSLEQKNLTCEDFAEQIQHNAESSGYKCGIVAINFDSTPSGCSHFCNVFDTSDRGLIFIDCSDCIMTEDLLHGDYIVNIEKGKPYCLDYMFLEDDFINSDIDNISSYEIYW